jgi:uncharacterized membrane protein YfcA
MLAGIVLGTLAGTGLLTGSHAGQAAVALGILLMLYAGLGLASLRFSVAPATEWWPGPLIGALTGLVTAATGVFVIPAVPYLGALGLSKDNLIQALGLSFTVSTIALAAALAAGGARLRLEKSAPQRPHSRQRFSARRLAGLCAGASASGPSGRSFSAACWCLALTSHRAR